MKRVFILAIAALAFASCNNAKHDGGAPAKDNIAEPASNEAVVAKKDAPVGCRSYFDVYGPVKTLQYEFANGSKGKLLEFDEKGMEKGMLASDREFLELNSLPESESTIKVDEEGKLVSFGIEGFVELKYNGIYVEQKIEHPTDLGPAYSPEYFVYDSNGDRIARFFAKLEAESLIDKYKDNESLMLCDPDILNCVFDRYVITKRDKMGNWTERTAYDNQVAPGQGVYGLTTLKRIITYYE